MPTTLLPEADHILNLALDKALVLIRAGQMTDAVRTLAVATAAADLIDGQRETLDVPDRQARPSSKPIKPWARRGHR